ncbi:MAG: GldG family protein [Myxococcaceae bacterium]
MKTFGKIAGAWGLLLLLPAPLIFFLADGTYAAAMGALGIVLCGVYIATHLDRFKGEAPAAKDSMGATARSGFFYTSSIIIGLVAIALAGGVNFIASKRGKTWDLTRKKIYSLSPQTVTTLKDLKEPIKAIGFIPPTHEAWDALDHLLKQYAEQSDKFTYEFKDPSRNPDLAQKYQLKEGQTTFVLTRGSGPLETHTTLNIISEQELTNALIKLSKVGEQKVYYLMGHGEFPLVAPPREQGGEPAVEAASEFKRSLEQEGYSPSELNLLNNPVIPSDASLLIVAGPKVKLAEGEKAAIDKWLGLGGRLLFFANATADAGIDDLLEKYGVSVDKGLLVDDRLNPKDPYAVRSLFYGDHEITQLIKQMQLGIEFPGTRGLSLTTKGKAEGVIAEPLVTTSPYAWEESTPDANPKLDSGEKAGAIPIVIASAKDTDKVEGKKFDQARVVVFGCSLILADVRWGDEANRNLVMNSVAWASAQIQKISIRPPDRDISVIDLDDRLMLKIRFLSIAVLPLLLLGVGMSIWITRRNK